MKIFHITRSTILTSGVSAFVAEIASAQAAMGHDVTVVCRWKPEYPLANGANYNVVKYFGRLKERPDVVHIEAILSWYMARAMIWCLWKRIPYVVSPHGGLMPRVFQKGRIKKSVVWHLLLKHLLRKAKAICCTSESESDACKSLGLRGPFVYSPLGVKLPEVTNNPHTRKNTILFLGRLGEEKGLLDLLSAWKLVAHDGWTLKLAGPDWRGHKKALEAKIVDDDIIDVVFTGNADSEAKDELYREASLFVLPSPMENFSLVVLEALSYGVPVIATTGTPWRELLECRCGWWINPGMESLEWTLRKALAIDDAERCLMGENGRQLVKEKYSWPIIAGELLKEYCRHVETARKSL